MAWYDIFTTKKIEVVAAPEEVTALQVIEPEAIQPQMVSQMPTMKALSDWAPGYDQSPVINVIYTGEKNWGELGPILKYRMDHDRLGKRAWQLYLGSEAIWTVVRQKGRWLLGTGLRLDAEPKVEVLKTLGIEIDAEEFNDTVEALWELYAYTPRIADYANRHTLHKIAKRADKNINLRGDVLVILRVDENYCVKVQLVDGTHVSTPANFSIIASTDKLIDNFIGYDYLNPTTNNRVRFGVEIDDNGEHVAYHVRTGIGLQWQRVEAKNRFGSLVAYLVTGEEYTLDDPRGIPSITPNMETSKHLDDYTSATVSSAIERQRIAYFIQHEKGSEGADPRVEAMAKVVGGALPLDYAVDANGKQLANTIAVSTERNTFNLTPGATIASPDSKQELHHSEFNTTLENTIFSSQDLPPEVGRMLFGNSYSASRAAMNVMGVSLNIDRDDRGTQFYQPIYNLQLDVWVLTFKVQAPGYIDALRKKNEMVLAAYRFAKWVGDPIPEIDELKAVQAERLKMGEGTEHQPLTTGERSTKKLGTGNFKANVKQVAKEREETLEAGIKPVEQVKPQQGNNNDDDPDDEEDDKPKKKDK